MGDLCSSIEDLLEALASKQVRQFFSEGTKRQGIGQEELKYMAYLWLSIYTVVEDAQKWGLLRDDVMRWLRQVQDTAGKLHDWAKIIHVGGDQRKWEPDVEMFLLKSKVLKEKGEAFAFQEKESLDTKISNSNSQSQCKFDVFLSFRGADTRHGFCGHLSKALQVKGINAFFDDGVLTKGEEMPVLLLKAIEESRIAIVVFSKNYAGSRWCLDELVAILRCRERRGMIVVPVFYDVDPSEVRRQSGAFKEAFRYHHEIFEEGKVNEWRHALTKVTSISGWDAQIFRRNESLLIDKIVEDVLRKLTFSSVDNYKKLVGMKPRLNEVLSYLCMEQSDVRTIGIWGTRGTGKTTLAKEVFGMCRHRFDASCFLDDVGDEYEKCSLIHLQNKLYEGLSDSKGSIVTLKGGINLLRSTLSLLKVLIILDNVNGLDQIETLVGKAEEQPNWLGPGSRVVVITTERQLLVRYGAKDIPVMKLTREESLELFCKEAFHEGYLRDDHEEFLEEIVNLAKGIPSALKFIGSSLRGKPKEEWSLKVGEIKLGLWRISKEQKDQEQPDDFCKSSSSLTTAEGTPQPSNQEQITLTSLQSLTSVGCSNVDEQQHDRLGDEGSGLIAVTTINEKLLERLGEILLDESQKLRDSSNLIENLLGEDNSRYVSVVTSQTSPNLTKLPFSKPELQLLTAQSSATDGKQSILGSAKDCGMHEHHMPSEPTDVFFHAFIQELIKDGKLFGISFPCNRVPNLFSHGSSKPIISVKLSSGDNESSVLEGVALSIVFLIKEDQNVDEDSELKTICCYLNIDECKLKKTILFGNIRRLEGGSVGICCYIPQQWFEGELTESSRIITTLFSTERLNVELKMCGVHLIYRQDVEEFSKALAQAANEHREVGLDFSGHCQKLLNGSITLKSFADIISKTGYNLSKELSTSRKPPQVAEQSDSNSTSQMRREIKSLLSRLFQGCNAQNVPFYFVIPLRFFSYWFFHHSMGDTTICYLPPNAYNDESWLGLELYVIFKRRPTILRRNLHSGRIPSLLLVDFYAHGDTTIPILTYPLLIDNAFYGSHFAFFHVPRESFLEELNQCLGISTLVRPSTPDLEVEMCGTRLLYEQDSESFIQEIINSTQEREDASKLLHHQIQMYLKGATRQRDKAKQQVPDFGLFSSFEREKIEWLQKLLTSTEQVAEDVRTLLQNYRLCVTHNQAYKDFDPVLLHSKHWVLDNHDLNYETVGGPETSRDLFSTLNHLHIMAETLMGLGSDLKYWKEDLQELLLKDFSEKLVWVTLSFKGHLAFDLKHFDPCSTYNLCFPQNEILKWFKDQNRTSTFKIGDNQWRGLVICAAFFVHDDNQHQIFSSDMHLKIMCHLKAGKFCLNPVPMYSLTEEKLKWLSRGFVWLTYMPRSLLAELNEQGVLELKIHSESPYLMVKACETRFLYQEDVEEFKQTIIQCWTSLFDNLDSLYQLAADEDDE